MFDPALRGHGAIRQRLLDRLGTGTLSGSLLFTGAEGIGKRRVAMELAQRELCFAGSACGRCAGCSPFKGDPLPVEWPNLLRIAPEGKAGLIKIGAIREDDLTEGGVIAWAHQAPPPRCHRWILVEDAHRLGGAAANMLLKTLEEPPEGTHFLLVTHRPEAVLHTIRSRCERIPFGSLAPEDAWAIAEASGWEAAEKARWTALSGGTLRFLDRQAFERAVAQLEAWIALGSGRSFATAAGPLLPEKNSEISQGGQVAQALELLLLVLADVARLRDGVPQRLDPWQKGLQTMAQGSLGLKAPQDAAYRALRNLGRNPSAESLLREVALTLIAA